MRFLIAYLIAGMLLGAGADAQTKTGPDFNRDVRPILSQHCFKCHGPDGGQRQAGLRLDQRTAALMLLPSKTHAIVPGKPQSSLLVTRIFTHGGGQMPPAYANKPLSEAQKETLRRWIASGAGYQPHWAFVPPKSILPPKIKSTAWPRNPIDNFILARLEKEGLRPSPPADRYTLIRRVYLDLIGLPPTIEQTNVFVSDKSPNAYEKLVDSLLASPHYGERWARRWLDLARYADTNGYEKDRPRSIWPYRDWVIDALNTDMPFSQFTIEQIAGDMLPNATPSQCVATGFHRNTMLNEEGGIDPLEYRYYSVVDRVATTGTTWLGLTVGCAQCHTHKFDPITHRDYYRLMAFLNNADENTLDISKPDIAAKRREIEAQAAERDRDLAAKFPAKEAITWTPLAAASAFAASGAQMERLPDHSIRLSGVNPDKDTYTITLDSEVTDVSAIRLEALPDTSLGNNGPGRTPHGNFVLTELTVSAAPKNASAPAVPIKLAQASADFAQDGFSPQNAIDGKPDTGWAIAGTGNWNVARTITFTPDKPLHFPAGSRWMFRLAQEYGGHHTIGKFRLSLGQALADARPLEARRRENLERHFADWLQAQETGTSHWQVLRPTRAASNLPLLTLQNDDSVFVSGDMTKRDVYDLDFAAQSKPITAIRLEVLPDARLPQGGPGRIFYEGSAGDFFLSEINLLTGGKPVPFASATQNGGNSAQAAIDGDPQTGWGISGRQGQVSVAVFRLARPLPAASFGLRLIFERYFAAALGRFRISVSSDPPAGSVALLSETEADLLTPAAQRSQAQNARLMQTYLTIVPELQSEREAIAALRRQMPAYPTSLVFSERPADNPRLTYIHHRGEYLQTEAKVTPGVPGVLPSLPANAPLDRLTLARWLVSPENPLVSRVAVNRQWAAFFGRGIVRTTEDFGYQGDPPTHPELLDWMARYFVQKDGGNWSLKKLNRLIVTSATYRQASRSTPELLTHDPENRLLARGPRVRLEAEQLRDYALTASGLLSGKIGGPSVFPPQSPGVTSEGTYGPLAWNVSQGEDRYRRGLYTFSKRTAPYAMLTTFDAPSGEACVARRDVSNTPLQALTLLNDQVFLEAAQALGKQAVGLNGTEEARLNLVFRRCLTRPPSPEEMALLLKFYAAQKARFEHKELDALAIAGAGEGDVNVRAAWTLVARSLLNLDETITKR